MTLILSTSLSHTDLNPPWFSLKSYLAQEVLVNYEI